MCYDRQYTSDSIFFLVVFGVSFVRCERCNFTKNHGSDTKDEFGAAIGTYLVNQFSNKEAVPRNEFIDWYAKALTVYAYPSAIIIIRLFTTTIYGITTFL